MDRRLLLLVSVLGTASALFEDQAFKFDWKQSFVGTHSFCSWSAFQNYSQFNCHQIIIPLGQVTDGGFYSSSKASVFVVATESHVVRRCPLCPKTHQNGPNASVILRCIQLETSTFCLFKGGRHWLRLRSAYLAPRAGSWRHWCCESLESESVSEIVIFFF